MERRGFISLAGMGVLSACLPGTPKKTKKPSDAKNTDLNSSFMGHQFPALPFAYNSLEPYIDARTVEIHYDKHHHGYFRKFLKAIKGTNLEKTPMHKIFSSVSTYDDNVRNNGGGYYNHMLYWENLSPNGGQPSGRLLSKLIKHFKSLDEFKLEFNNSAKTLFGSGWTWLILNDNRELQIVSTSNQDNPLMDIVETRGIPLLTIDIWEHAYYLKYQNRRADYINNFWNIINWNTVNNRFANAIKGSWKG